MDVCKCIVPLRHGGTLNSGRATSPLVWLVDGIERCHLALCHDEFRGPRSSLYRSGGISNNNRYHLKCCSPHLNKIENSERTAVKLSTIDQSEVIKRLGSTGLEDSMAEGDMEESKCRIGSADIQGGPEFMAWTAYSSSKTSIMSGDVNVFHEVDDEIAEKFSDSAFVDQETAHDTFNRDSSYNAANVIYEFGNIKRKAPRVYAFTKGGHFSQAFRYRKFCFSSCRSFRLPLRQDSSARLHR
ncbi:hypothetical protein TNCV_1569821 [Trichonephila clavipes]|uniref:Uncharacterized protein n=1 Tax=Trichonephila clavipes TaxID=2585209 RepID=A0A8X6VJJ4_TRICX|nr:hypothetical protein TNCV_1569821 [Trichonephila clavipes]